MAKNVTYEIKKTKPIIIHKKNEKHAFTTVLSGFDKSKVLWFEIVWKFANNITFFAKNALQKSFTVGHQFAFNWNSFFILFIPTEAYIA